MFSYYEKREYQAVTKDIDETIIRLVGADKWATDTIETND